MGECGVACAGTFESNGRRQQPFSNVSVTFWQLTHTEETRPSFLGAGSSPVVAAVARCPSLQLHTTVLAPYCDMF